MGTVTFLLFWVIAGVDTLVLLSSLNKSSPQNVPLEGETWPLQQPPAGGGEKLKWEEEAETQITVTLKEDEKVDEVYMQKVEQKELQISDEVEDDEQKESNKKKQGHSKENKTRNKDLSPTTVPPLITISITPYPTDMTDKDLLSSPAAYFLALTNTSMSSNSDNSTYENFSLGQIESLEEKVDATGTAEEARASPTALSLPRTFKLKPKPKTRDKHISKKKNLQKKVKKVKDKGKKTLKNATQSKLLKPKNDQLASVPYFPYFKDHYCPPDCACYGRVVQCSDKGLEKVPYGIPFNSRYILLMNNLIKSLPLDLLSEYLSMEFLVLSNNRLLDSSVEGAFEGIQALKRLYLDRNLLQSVPTDLPASLEELRLDGNRVKVMSEVAWFRCPGLLILSLSNNSLESTSSSFPVGVLSSLSNLRTLSLSHNHLTTVPLRLPLSLQELYLRSNLIQRFQAGVFQGKVQLQVLDLSANRLTNKGLGKDALINATHLESLNLEGNFLKQVPRYLPQSLKTLNLEGNSIFSISKTTFLSLPHLEHLGLARNKISKVVPGAFWGLPLLHQLDLSYNMLHLVPHQLPTWLIFIALNHNKIQTIPHDAFCSFRKSEETKSRLVRVQLEHNLVDLGNLDSVAFRCLTGFQVVHFY